MCQATRHCSRRPFSERSPSLLALFGVVACGRASSDWRTERPISTGPPCRTTTTAATSSAPASSSAPITRRGRGPTAIRGVSSASASTVTAAPAAQPASSVTAPWPWSISA